MAADTMGCIEPDGLPYGRLRMTLATGRRMGRKMITIPFSTAKSRHTGVISFLSYFFMLVAGEQSVRMSRKLAAVFIVAGLASACAAVPAMADTGVATSFGFSQVNSSSFNYPNPTITLGGTLWDTAASPNTPLPDEPVAITEQVAGTGAFQAVGSTTTDSSGNFTFTLNNQSAGGIFEAVFAGDTSNGNDYDATTSSPVKVTPAYSDVDVSYTETPSSPVAVGSTVTYSGTVYVPADDNMGTNAQTPIAGANVSVFSGGQSTSSSPHAVTGNDGTFSISFKPPSTATYHLEVDASEPWPYCLYTSQIEAARTITVMNSEKPDYWLTTDTGSVYSFNASGGGPLPSPSLPATVDGIAANPSTGGYWLTTTAGNVYNHNASWYGSEAGKTLPGPIVGIATDPKTDGYWLVTNQGNVYNFNAPWYGSEAGKALPSPVSGIASVGNGYVLVTTTGNVYNFNTPWHGSEAGKTLSSDVAGVAGDSKTGGYWLVTNKGNVYNFDAPWHGSEAGQSLPGDIMGIAADSATGGYWLTGTKGNVYNFDAPWYGSESGANLPGPIVGISSAS